MKYMKYMKAQKENVSIFNVWNFWSVRWINFDRLTDLETLFCIVIFFDHISGLHCNILSVSLENNSYWMNERIVILVDIDKPQDDTISQLDRES